MFNAHNNVTANGVVISKGLWVVTNDLTIGQVVGDNDDREFGCCQPTDLVGDQDPNFAHEFMTEEQRDHVHAKGQKYIRDMQAWFTDHMFQCEFGPHSHNHWFEVQTKQGRRSYDGERMATVESRLKMSYSMMGITVEEATEAGWRPQV